MTPWGCESGIRQITANGSNKPWLRDSREWMLTFARPAAASIAWEPSRHCCQPTISSGSARTSVRSSSWCSSEANCRISDWRPVKPSDIQPGQNPVSRHQYECKSLRKAILISWSLSLPQQVRRSRSRIDQRKKKARTTRTPHTNGRFHVPATVKMIAPTATGNISERTAAAALDI